MKLLDLQLSVYGLTLIAALCACGTSHPQNNSNTNWLRQCSAAADCSGDELCACGVCTVSCNSDEMCQSDRAPDAVCSSVAALECSGSGKGAVCTASCKRDKDCGDGELSCVEGSCIEAKSSSGKLERDAAVGLDGGDAQVEGEDSGSKETTKPMIADPGIPIEESRPAETSPLWSGHGCEPAVEDRPICNEDADCDSGLVCHIDHTCIEPGKCDALGTTTYASVPDVEGLTVTKDGVFLLEAGTEDALGNHRSDGAIVRVGFDGSVEPMITGLYRPLDMKMDPTRVYWRSGTSGEITLSSADRPGGTNRVEIPFAGANLQWDQSATHIYLATDEHPPRFEVYRFAKGTSDLEKLSSDSWSGVVSSLFVDSKSLYLSSESDGRWSLADHTFGAGLRLSEATSLDHDRFFYVEPNLGSRLWRISEVSKSDDRLITVAEVPFLGDSSVPTLQSYRDHVYFTIADGGNTTLYRAPIIPGESEKMLGQGDAFVTAISDRGVFWIQDHRLLSKVIEDYADGVSPAQGAEGGPCFGDLACDDGLTCVDAVCEVVVPTCEERLGCGPDEACLDEHCQKLWSGNGCEPAAGTRPACSSDTDCGPGTLCHLDGTCIEPGQCDRFGLTSYAAVGAVDALTVTKDEVFLLGWGSEDPLGNHNHDGAIERVSLRDASTHPVVTGLTRPLGLLVDHDRVYWASRADNNQVSALSVRRSDGTDLREVAVGPGFARWAQDGSAIYAAVSSGGGYDLDRIAKPSAAVETLTHVDLSAMYGFVIDGEYVYMSGTSSLRWSLAGGTVDPGLDFNDPAFVGRDQIYFGGGDGIESVRKNDASLTILASFGGEGSATWLQPLHDHIFFAEGTADRVLLKRAPLVPGESELLASAGQFDVFGGVSDQGLFWVHDDHLVRMMIDESDNASPAQGADGGPCYGDLGCDDGLTCVDALCE